VKNAIFLTSLRPQNRENPGKKPSRHAQPGPVSKSLQNDKNDLPKYGQYGEKHRFNSVYGGFEILSFFTIPLL